MKTALGRGLEALIPDSNEGIKEIELEKIKPNPEQPRKIFDKEALQDLASSIKEKGILQPVIVREAGGEEYYLIAGERRWRAASLIGLRKIPVIIRDSDSRESLEIALIENIQRDDLSPIETAEAFQRLIGEYLYTQEDLSKRVGKNRATIANYLRLLKLPIEIKEHVNSRELSMGHAKAIVSLETRQLQIDAARIVLKKGLSVRETEMLCKRLREGICRKDIKKVKDPNITTLEEKLRHLLGTKVQVKHSGKRGKIEIEYYSLDELDRLIEILTGDAGSG